MKKLLILVLALSLLAPNYIDQLTSDFTAGTTTNTNISADQIRLSNSGGNYSSSGTFVSQVFDLGSNPTGTIAWTSTSPSQTSLLVNTRSGPTPTPDGSWSSYSSNYATPTGSTLSTPTNRYHQYRLTLSTTNQTRTPTINAITLQYTQNGPNITADTAQNSDLDEDTTGAYRFYINAEDTVSLSSVQARYRIGTDAYSSYAPMTQVNSTSYYLDISETWSTRGSENLSVEVNATNTNALSNTATLTELIDNINNAPVLSSLSDRSAIEGQELRFSVTASDADSDTLTYSADYGSLTKFTNTIADYAWTPMGSNVGLTNVTITVSDGEDTDSQTFTVNTTASEKSPIIRAISDVVAYYGDRIVIDVVVDDGNQGDNHTFVSTPDIGLEKINTSNTSTVYLARANFSAFDDEKGTQIIDVTVRDTSGLSDSANFSLTVNYCGDNTCQSQETAETCPRDCLSASDQQLSYIALEFPDRICTNASLNIISYNASSRYACFVDGKTTDAAAAWCEVIDGVDYQFYRLDGELRIDQGTTSTNAEGIGTFTATQSGRYRILASAQELVGTSEIFTVRDCSNDINNQQQIIRVDAPELEAQTLPETPVRQERPDIVNEPASILSIVIFYMIIPLLLAAMIYVSNEYYTLYKDTDPRILTMRLKYEELKMQYWPKIEPYWNKVLTVLDPVIQLLKTYVVVPVAKLVAKIRYKFEKR